MEHRRHNHSSDAEHPKSDVSGDLKFTCPMHPQIIQDRPGNCPICGMNLVPDKKSEGGHAGIDHHHMMIVDINASMLIIRYSNSLKPKLYGRTSS